MPDAVSDPEPFLLADILSAQRGVLNFQPVMRPNGQIVFQEALLRLLRPDGEMISPAKFIPWAEAQGRTAELDMIALSLATGLLDQSATLRLSINLHPASLPSLRLRAAFSAVPQHIMDRLIVEVTEHGPVTDDGTETLRTLRRAGAAVFLDDFGAGAQSLSLLREGLCDGIKLDRCLIGGISASPEKRAIVRALIALGEELDLMVVAEGIEQQPDADWLQANGIHAMQGYLLGRPQRQARHLGLAVAS